MSKQDGNDRLELSHWAEEARALADDMIDPGAKRTLVGIAEVYEAMLKRAERKNAEKL